jgi:hypothetical protein
MQPGPPRAKRMESGIGAARGGQLGATARHRQDLAGGASPTTRSRGREEEEVEGHRGGSSHGEEATHRVHAEEEEVHRGCRRRATSQTHVGRGERCVGVDKVMIFLQKKETLPKL